MKHFEKLWKKNGGGVCGKHGCEKYYREALLWVWKTLEHITPGDYELLDKELENETS